MKIRQKPTKEQYENLIDSAYEKALDDESGYLANAKSGDILSIGILMGYWQMLDHLKNQMIIDQIKFNEKDLQHKIDDLMIRADELLEQAKSKKND